MYALSGLAIVVAIILTTISVLRLCSEECAEGHNYRLFGMPFEVSGAIFFASLAIIHVLQRWYDILKVIEPLLFASALGAELMFIIIQRYYIGTWCPVCLGIATCIAVGVGSFAASFVRNYKTLKHIENKGEGMNSFRIGISNIVAVFMGFFIAFMGISKQDAMQAAQDTIRDNVAFGNKNSQIEVYLFTDWACPACRKLEPQLEDMTKAITNDNKFIFVDHVVHPETLNFIPYHLSFILNNKEEYFKLRGILTEISEKTGEPSEKEIAAAAAKVGVKYNEINYSDIALAIKYYKKLGEKFNIKGTPTMVIINTETKKGKKLAGNGEITKANVVNAIKTLKEQ
jgi:hypothetical protein